MFSREAVMVLTWGKKYFSMYLGKFTFLKYMKEPTEEVELRNIAGEPLTQEDRENLYTRFRKFGKALKDNVKLEKIGETRATVSVGLDRIETVLRMAAANFPRIKEELVTPVTITDNLGRYVIKRSSNRIEVTLCQFLRREDDPHFEMAAGSMSIGKEGVSGEVIGNIYERKNSAGQDMREEHGLQFDYKDEGQLKGIEKMAINKRNCSEILQQISAVKKAIDSLSKEIVISDICRYVTKNKMQEVQQMVERAINL